MPDGYVFPNEFVEWTVLIANYPFITGLVAGSFIVSSLTYVFGKERFRFVSKLALLVSLTFLIISPLPLVAHLTQPSRAYEIMLRPNFASAMAVFGYVYLAYLLLASSETLFLFREGSIKRQTSAKGIMKTVYRVLSLGSIEATEQSLQRDHKIVKTLAMIGIPLAVFFHGYVGFIFGAVKANPIWLTPLMPIIFILSAIVSGIALLSWVYVLATRLSGAKPVKEVVTGLGVFLAWFLVIDFGVEALEVLYRAYEQLETWPGISMILFDKLNLTYVWMELVFGAIVPLLILALPQARRSQTGILLASALALQGTHAMRYNIVMGAQFLSRTGEGFLSYVPPLLGKESMMTTIGIYSMGFFVMLVLLTIFPWREEEAKTLG